MAERSVKETESESYKQMTQILGPEGVVMLEKQLNHLFDLNGRDLTSPLRNAFKRGDTTLPAGTLLHGVCRRGYDATVLSGIAENGIISGELVGVVEDAETHGCADFFRVVEDMSLADYLAESKEPLIVGALRMQKGERMLTKGVALIVDTQTEGVSELLENDGYRNTEMSEFVSLPSTRTADNTSAILGGIPRGAIAGIVVQEKLLRRTDAAQVIAENFPGVPVFDEAGSPLQDFYKSA